MEAEGGGEEAPKRSEPTVEQSAAIEAAIAARSGGGFHGFRGAPPATLDGEEAVRITEDTFAGGMVSNLRWQSSVSFALCDGPLLNAGQRAHHRPPPLLPPSAGELRVSGAHSGRAAALMGRKPKRGKICLAISTLDPPL